MTTKQIWTEEMIEVAGVDTQLYKGGNGPPLLILHEALANPAWAQYHEALAQRFTVYAPSHPGYDKSERPGWVSTVTDVAHFYLGMLQSLGLHQVSLMGFSIGGWIAAEIAAMCPDRVNGLVLVGAVGVKPQAKDIAEVMMVSPEQVKSLAYYDQNKAPGTPELTADEERVLWRNREMTSRLCWKPYMHNPKLPEYLKLINIPALIVWGRQDGVVPSECGEIYQQVLMGSVLHLIDQCGHSPQIEKPDEFLGTSLKFLSSLC